MYSSADYEYGHQTLAKISEKYVTYKSGISLGPSDNCLLERLMSCKGIMEGLAAKILKEILHLCIEDDAICKYVYEMAPPTLQYARYSDFFQPYIE